MTKAARRRGKIALLPKGLRDEVNRMIEDNAGSRAIIKFLEGRGHRGINKVNITHWVQGDGAGSSGYQDWQGEQRALAELKAQEEFALDIVRQNKGHTLHDAARLLAVSQLAQLFSQLDVQSLTDSLSAHPQNYVRLLNSLSKLSRDSRDYERYEFDRVQREQKKEARSGRRAKKGGLSPEAIALFERELNLL